MAKKAEKEVPENETDPENEAEECEDNEDTETVAGEEENEDIVPGSTAVNGLWSAQEEDDDEDSRECLSELEDDSEFTKEENDEAAANIDGDANEDENADGITPKTENLIQDPFNDKILLPNDEKNSELFASRKDSCDVSDSMFSYGKMGVLLVNDDKKTESLVSTKDCDDSADSKFYYDAMGVLCIRSSAAYDNSSQNIVSKSSSLKSKSLVEATSKSSSSISVVNMETLKLPVALDKSAVGVGFFSSKISTDLKSVPKSSFCSASEVLREQNKTAESNSHKSSPIKADRSIKQYFTSDKKSEEVVKSMTKESKTNLQVSKKVKPIKLTDIDLFKDIETPSNDRKSNSSCEATKNKTIKNKSSPVCDSRSTKSSSNLSDIDMFSGMDSPDIDKSVGISKSNCSKSSKSSAGSKRSRKDSDSSFDDLPDIKRTKKNPKLEEIDLFSSVEDQDCVVSKKKSKAKELDLFSASENSSDDDADISKKSKSSNGLNKSRKIADSPASMDDLPDHKRTKKNHKLEEINLFSSVEDQDFVISKKKSKLKKLDLFSASDNSSDDDAAISKKSKSSNGLKGRRKNADSPVSNHDLPDIKKPKKYHKLEEIDLFSSVDDQNFVVSKKKPRPKELNLFSASVDSSDDDIIKTKLSKNKTDESSRFKKNEDIFKSKSRQNIDPFNDSKRKKLESFEEPSGICKIKSPSPSDDDLIILDDNDLPEYEDTKTHSKKLKEIDLFSDIEDPHDFIGQKVKKGGKSKPEKLKDKDLFSDFDDHDDLSRQKVDRISKNKLEKKDSPSSTKSSNDSIALVDTKQFEQYPDLCFDDLPDIMSRHSNNTDVLLTSTKSKSKDTKLKALPSPVKDVLKTSTPTPKKLQSIDLFGDSDSLLCDKSSKTAAKRKSNISYNKSKSQVSSQFKAPRKLDKIEVKSSSKSKMKHNEDEIYNNNSIEPSSTNIACSKNKSADNGESFDSCVLEKSLNSKNDFVNKPKISSSKDKASVSDKPPSTTNRKETKSKHSSDNNHDRNKSSRDKSKHDPERKTEKASHSENVLPNKLSESDRSSLFNSSHKKSSKSDRLSLFNSSHEKSSVSSPKMLKESDKPNRKESNESSKPSHRKSNKSETPSPSTLNESDKLNPKKSIESDKPSHKKSNESIKPSPKKLSEAIKPSPVISSRDKKELADAVIAALMPKYKEGSIKSKDVFKVLAKRLTALLQTKYETYVKEGVRLLDNVVELMFLKVGGTIGDIGDVDTAVGSELEDLIRKFP